MMVRAYMATLPSDIVGSNDFFEVTPYEFLISLTHQNQHTTSTIIVTMVFIGMYKCVWMCTLVCTLVSVFYQRVVVQIYVYDTYQNPVFLHQ